MAETSPVNAVKKPVIQLEHYDFAEEDLAKCRTHKHVVDVRDYNGDGITDFLLVEGCLLEIEEGESQRIYHVQQGPEGPQKNFGIYFGEKSEPASLPVAEKKDSPQTPAEKKAERLTDYVRRRYGNSRIRRLREFSWARNFFCSERTRVVLPIHLSSEEKLRLGLLLPDKNCVTTDCSQGSMVLSEHKGLWYANIKKIFDTEDIHCLSPHWESALMDELVSVFVEGAKKIYGSQDAPDKMWEAVSNFCERWELESYFFPMIDILIRMEMAEDPLEKWWVR